MSTFKFKDPTILVDYLELALSVVFQHLALDSAAEFATGLVQLIAYTAMTPATSCQETSVVLAVLAVCNVKQHGWTQFQVQSIVHLMMFWMMVGVIDSETNRI